MATQVNKVAFNVLLTPDQAESLKEYAQKTGISRGHIIRVAVDSFLRMKQTGNPTCADGTHCLCLGRWGHVGPAKRVEADTQ